MKHNKLKFKTLIVLMLSTVQLFSQNIINKEFVLKQVIQNSKLIFETKSLIKGKSFRASNNVIYTNYEAKIEQVIFGISNESKINLIIEGGQVEENGLLSGSGLPHGLVIEEDIYSTVFCNPVNMDNLTNTYIFTEQVCYNIKNEIIVTNALSKYYKNINELYIDLSKELKINISEKKSLDLIVNESNQLYNSVSYAQNQNNYNNHTFFFRNKKRQFSSSKNKQSFSNRFNY